MRVNAVKMEGETCPRYRGPGARTKRCRGSKYRDALV